MKTVINLRLFVTGENETARRAIENLETVCDDPAVKSDYNIHIEVVDVVESPHVAEEDKILVTPTLLRKLPLPVRRVVGDLSDENDIFMALDITSSPSPNEASNTSQ